ncbi:MAG: signal recognition particle-docking protein FtsY [Candidatus Sericytochromatia bacterium]|uniref:Signal recognition particle receptor FtsY n=1 Tax=Candidatus Tanganyikabacteria bacterium TaxID=2961651 RepID=A0A937X7X2_9BACT|nr:signal recognition particle-docking protein FtsY [Candidatus Tanganyikabacteria bacterium]
MDREFIETIAEKLSTTRKVLVDKVNSLVKGRTKIDEELLEELEELLIESDMGVKVADGALEHLRAEHKAGRLTPDGVTDALASHLKGKLGMAAPLHITPGTLHILMLVGVNGTGKTTTLGKLAHRCVSQGLSVVVAAADTFRAAAIDQLEIWAERAGVPLIRHAEGGDAAAVVYDAIASARSRGADIVLVDTAGRLHNKANLMQELAKIRRIVDREAPDSPKEVLLVLDATTGQNGLRQAEVFGEAVNLTGVVLTKLDGTAKGGVIFAIRDQLGLPVKLAGLGEGIADLRDFDPEVFVEALFSEKVEAAPQVST